MATVTKEFIIQSIYTYPRTEREHGFNSAMILILKTLIDAPQSPDLTSMATRDKMRVSFAHFNQLMLFTSLTTAQIDEVVDHINSQSKLQALKSLKDFTGLGLKESKDIIDFYCTI